jgi:PAS domain-containing protein
MSQKPTYEELEQKIMELEQIIRSDFKGMDVRLASAYGKLADGAYTDSKDVDDVMKTVSDLRQSEIKLKSVFNAMSEGVCLHEIIYDADGKAIDYKILDVNPAYETLIQIKKELALGRNASDLYGTGAPPSLDIFARVTETGASESFEIFWPPLEKYFVISAFSPGKGQFGTVFNDITPIRKAEEAIRDSENRFRAAFMMSPNAAVISTQEEGVWVETNRAALDIFLDTPVKRP